MKNRTMTLGEVIQKLEMQPQDNYIQYDFGGFIPDWIGSYRGYYDHLSMGFSEWSEVRVKDVLKRLTSAIGSTFEGYKGGKYMMRHATPLWVANYGNCTSTGIVGVEEYDDTTIIETAYCVY